ncbi:hypothetical protein GOODEAATRI_009790 [Goodea atripinnis]|uniref:GMP reductase n=1 Tax=Goodea atripinnis TaxID=208336 RepID=A0ABV0PMA9_9TELE
MSCLPQESLIISVLGIKDASGGRRPQAGLQGCPVQTQKEQPEEPLGGWCCYRLGTESSRRWELVSERWKTTRSTERFLETLFINRTVDLQRTFTFRNSKQTYTGIPIIAANMDTTGTFEMAKVLSKAVPALKYICLDVANGYAEYFVEFVKTVREKFPKHTIMAGNVVTGEMVEELILSGADIIKVGIGPGAGADFVMMGGMLAGHDECTGEIIEKNGKKYKLFYGMSSDTAMKKYVGGVAEYRWGTGIIDA